MKNILITGANSYVGMSFEKWLSQWPDKYHVDTIDMIDGTWKEKSFEGYDAVFHVAGIAHVSADPSKEELYYRVNRDLAIETAQKAKADGARQFVFMSSIIIYGDSAPIGKTKIITKETRISPIDFYGDSKYQAEKGILPLQDIKFQVVILRPPMIYGYKSKGNYPKLANLARKTPIFPDIDNCRSMIYIENLAEYIRIIIDGNKSGIFFPQNEEYVKTSTLVKEIAKVHGKDLCLTKIFNPLLEHIMRHSHLLNKAFGNLYYDKTISDFEWNYNVCNFVDSVKKTEIGEFQDVQ